jgi:hypothetical protein
MAGVSQKASGDYKPGRLFLIDNEFLNNQDDVSA